MAGRRQVDVGRTRSRELRPVSSDSVVARREARGETLEKWVDSKFAYAFARALFLPCSLTFVRASLPLFGAMSAFGTCSSASSEKKQTFCGFGEGPGPSPNWPYSSKAMGLKRIVSSSERARVAAALIFKNEQLLI